MMSKRLQRNSVWLLTMGAALGSVACGGTIDFQDKSAIAIEAKGEEKPKPKKKKRVEVKTDKLEIDEKIQFEKGKATILHESDELLDEIVEVLKENPQIKKLAIEGHTSSEGGAELNRKLSQERAQAVLDYLVEHGIDKKRLQSKGYGPDKPIAGNDTEDDREKNRRVEFNIIEQDAKKK